MYWYSTHIHIHYTYIIHTLYIHYTYIIHTLYIHYTYIIHTLYIHYTYIIHTLLHYTYIIHILYIHYTYIIHTLYKTNISLEEQYNMMLLPARGCAVVPWNWSEDWVERPCIPMCASRTSPCRRGTMARGAGVPWTAGSALDSKKSWSGSVEKLPDWSFLKSLFLLTSISFSLCQRSVNVSGVWGSLASDKRRWHVAFHEFNEVIFISEVTLLLCRLGLLRLRIMTYLEQFPKPIPFPIAINRGGLG